MNDETPKPARRGFAAMDKERQREIASKGGTSVPDDKRSFSKDRDLAASAGRKGGEISRRGCARSPSRPGSDPADSGRGTKAPHLV